MRILIFSLVILIGASIVIIGPLPNKNTVTALDHTPTPFSPNPAAILEVLSIDNTKDAIQLARWHGRRTTTLGPTQLGSIVPMDSQVGFIVIAVEEYLQFLTTGHSISFQGTYNYPDTPNLRFEYIDILAVSITPENNTYIIGRGPGRFEQQQLDNIIVIWDIQNNELVYTFDNHQDTVTAVDIHYPLLATGSSDGVIKLLNLNLGEELWSAEAHNYGVTAVEISPNGTLMASAGNDNSVHVWDVATNKKIYTFGAYDNKVNDLAFSPSGNRLVSVSGVPRAPVEDYALRTWDLATGQLLSSLEFSFALFSVDFHPSGAFLVVGGQNNNISFVDATEQTVMHEIMATADGVVSDLGFSQDGKLLFSADAGNSVSAWGVLTE